jgi:hypothetical protein
MIDKIKRIAIAIQGLRLPSLFLGLFSLTALIVIILFFPSNQANRLIIPSIVGLLWGMGTYLFVVTFRSAPTEPTRSLSFFGKIKYALTRAWYWLISVILILGVIWTIVITIRMVSIWLRG